MTVFDNETFLRKQIAVLESANEILKARVIELEEQVRKLEEKNDEH